MDYSLSRCIRLDNLRLSRRATSARRVCVAAALNSRLSSSPKPISEWSQCVALVLEFSDRLLVSAVLLPAVVTTGELPTRKIPISVPRRSSTSRRTPIASSGPRSGMVTRPITSMSPTWTGGTYAASMIGATMPARSSSPMGSECLDLNPGPSETRQGRLLRPSTLPQGPNSTVPSRTGATGAG